MSGGEALGEKGRNRRGIQRHIQQVGKQQISENIYFIFSYSLILMVLHYLQVAADPPILPNLQVLYPDFFAASQPLADMNLFGELPHPLPSEFGLVVGYFDFFKNINIFKKQWFYFIYIFNWKLFCV